MSTERILVSESILDAFSEKLVASSIEVSTSVRPGASVEHASGITALLEDAREKGARILGGGEGAYQDGPFLTPRILVNVTPEMKIWHTETFAPIALLIPFSTVDEAIELANDTAYGLSASVFTANIPLAIDIGRRLESGSVHINSMTIHDEVHMPHGGVKESGWGRFGVPWGKNIQTRHVTMLTEARIYRIYTTQDHYHLRSTPGKLKQEDIGKWRIVQYMENY